MSWVQISIWNFGYQDRCFTLLFEARRGKCQDSKFKVIWHKDAWESADIAPRTFLTMALDESECKLDALHTLDVWKGTTQSHLHV